MSDMGGYIQYNGDWRISGEQTRRFTPQQSWSHYSNGGFPGVLGKSLNLFDRGKQSKDSERIKAEREKYDR